MLFCWGGYNHHKLVGYNRHILVRYNKNILVGYNCQIVVRHIRHKLVRHTPQKLSGYNRHIQGSSLRNTGDQISMTRHMIFLGFFLYRCYYQHTSKDSVSTVYVICLWLTISDNNIVENYLILKTVWWKKYDSETPLSLIGNLQELI